MRAGLAILAFLLPGELIAQARSVVSPAALERAEAVDASPIPCGVASPSSAARRYHYQEIHDLAMTATGKIDGLGYRRDGFSDRGRKAVSWTIELEIALSTAKTTSRTQSTVFGNNEGSDRVVALRKKKIRFPKVPHLPENPQPFAYRFPFDKFFSFKSGSLCIDVKVYDNDLFRNGSYNYVHFDRGANWGSPPPLFAGHGCYSSKRNALAPFHGFVFTMLTRSSSVYVEIQGASYQGSEGGVGLILLTGSRLSGGGVSLPGGCRLYVDPASLLLAIHGTGIFWTGERISTYYYPPFVLRDPTRRSVVVPWSAGLRGLRLYGQIVGIDPQANSFGLVFSNYAGLTLSVWDPNGLGTSLIYNSGSSFANRVAANHSKDAGLVTRISVR